MLLFRQRISQFDVIKMLFIFFSEFRYALKRNLHVLTFDVQIPFPNTSFIPFLLDNHPSLHKLSHFDIAADHMIYNREEFRQVMPKDTVYLSLLREPVAQFKSGVNFFVVIVLISHTERSFDERVAKARQTYCMALNIYTFATDMDRTC